MIKNKTKIVWLTMFAACAFAGCSDDKSPNTNENKSEDNSCQEGTLNPETGDCEQNAHKCAGRVCEDGKCNPETGECEPLDDKCANHPCPGGTCNPADGICYITQSVEPVSGDNNPAVKIVKLPANADGSDPWPDGITTFMFQDKVYFGIAAEASDSIIIVDDQGQTVSNTRITASMVPSDYPCLKDDGFPGVAYSPDSITAFALNGKVYLAATLRYASAVIIFDVTDPAAPVFELITHAGLGERQGTGECTDEDPKVYPEGISSGIYEDDAFVVVANEGDSSATMLRVQDIHSSASQSLATGISIKVTQSVTQDLGGNVESVRFVNRRQAPSFIAVSSKSRTIHYLELGGDHFLNYYADYVGSYAQSEYEFTNSAVFDETHTLISLTKPTKTGNEITSCGGELLIVNSNKTNESIGSQKVTSIAVGPMPDAIAISPNGRYAITADEQDSTAAWGKCPVNDGKPGVSIIQLSESGNTMLETPKLLKQIQFTQNEKSQPREPEYIAVGGDNDTVMVTLQDSHEVAVFKLSEILK